MSELEREKFEARFPPPPKEMKTALSHWIAKRDGWLARSESAPLDLRREIEVWAKALLLRAEIIEHDPYLQLTNLRVDLRELVKFLAAPGESAPAGCPQCGSVNRDYCNPECSNISTRNEWHRLAAPAPTEEK